MLDGGSVCKYVQLLREDCSYWKTFYGKKNKFVVSKHIVRDWLSKGEKTKQTALTNKVPLVVQW